MVHGQDQWQQDQQDGSSTSQWGIVSSDAREDQLPTVLPRHNKARRKSAPRDDAVECFHDEIATTSTTTTRKVSSSSSKSKRRLNRSKQRHIIRPDPEAFHADSPEQSTPRQPQHQSAGQSSGQPSLEHDYAVTTPRATLKEGKQRLLAILQKKIEPYNNATKTTKHKNETSTDFSADGSTASTSGSNSSSSSSEETALKSKGSIKSATSGSIGTEKMLERCSRQIRAELRQAEMMELAQEAERAAESGQKSFTGRASTFGRDELDIEIALEDHMIKHPKVPTPTSQRALIRVRRSLDFGTPLVRRLTLEPTKISVKALRDVGEVVPSFKDFHLHLRTHLLRRNVSKRTLVFEEKGKSPRRKHTTKPSNYTSCRLPRLGRDTTANSGSQHSASEQNVIHLWNSINFGSWTSSKRSVAESETSRRSLGFHDESGDSSKSVAELGELLADHMHTPLRGSRTKRAPQVDVPPGLRLANQETFELQTDAKEAGTSSLQLNARGVLKESSVADGDVLYPSTPKPSGADLGEEGFVTTSTSPTARQESRSRNPHQSGSAHYGNVQDGSPNSPIVVDDLDAQEGLTPDQNPKRFYQGPGPPPDLPLTPKGDFRRVFDSSFVTPREKRLQDMLATPISDSPDTGVDTSANMGMTGPDFVTPVRLRDIRDDNVFGQSAFAAGLPEAPFVGKSSSILETPNSIQEGHQEPYYPSRRDSVETSSHYGLDRRMDPLQSHTKRLSMRPSLDKMGSKATEALLDIAARASDYETIDNKLEVMRRAADKSTLGHAKVTADADPVVLDCEVLSRAKSASTENEVIALEDIYEDNDGILYNVHQHTLRQNYSMPVMSGYPPDEKKYDVPDIRRGVSYDAHHQPTHQRETMLHKMVDKEDATAATEQDSLANGSNVIVDLKDIDSLEMTQEPEDAMRGDQSKATADFRCECLISPASSLDSDDDDPGVSNREKQSSWNLMEHASITQSDSNHQSLKAAVAMLSRMSPTGDKHRKNVVCAPSKENDDFIHNYLYCSKATTEAPPPPEPICSGSTPCQDTKMPCGEVAVDSCVGNFLETALRFLPRKSAQNSKFISLSNKRNELQSKHLSWYDLINDKFENYLEKLIGNENGKEGLSYQAPSLKERKLPQHPYKAPSPPGTPPRQHEEIYDEDFGGIVYVQSGSSLEMNASHSSYQSSRQSLQSFHSELSKPRKSSVQRSDVGSMQGKKLGRLRSSVSDTADFDAKDSSLHHRNSM